MTNKGSTLILAYVMVAILLVFGASMYFTTISEKRFTTVYSNNTRAFWAAEAGAQRGLWEINNNNTTSSANWSMSGTLGSGIGDYNITYTASTFCITSSGYYPAFNATDRINRTVAVTLNNPSTPYFGYAVFGKSWVKIDNNADTDSFNSSFGSYAISSCSDPNCKGSVGTNGNSAGVVNLDNNADVRGNISTNGGNGSVTCGNNANYTGNITYNKQVDIPGYSVPQNFTQAVNNGTLTLNNNNVSSLSGGNYNFSYISLNNNANLTITGDVNITLRNASSLRLDNNAVIRVINNAKVKIFAEGSFSISNNAVVNNAGEIPANFLLYSNYSGNVTINNNGNFYGAIFAPNANITNSNNAHIYGSIVANTVNINNNGHIHYDEALANITNSSGVASVPTWREL